MARPTHRAFVIGLALLTTGLVGALNVVRAAEPAIESQYQRKLQSLAIDDIPGHLELARWCRDQEAYDLLLQECNYILSRDKDNKEAQLLLDLAKIKLQNEAQPEDAQPGETPTRGEAGKPKVLTDKQVQILKRKETKLDAREPARRLRVKIDDDALERFWNEFSAQRTLSRDARADFLKLHPGEKLKYILKEHRDELISPSIVEGITIENDPIIFEEYIRRVSPIILNGCAASQCHGGKKGGDFTLYNERVMTENLHYTNFLIMQEYEKGDQKLINRDFPDQSLLIQYGLPAEVASFRHPTDITPLFPSARDRKLQTVQRWIRQLDVPAPDYGISLEEETKP